MKCSTVEYAQTMKNSESDQKVPQLQTADKPVTSL